MEAPLMTYRDAILDAQDLALTSDPKVFIMGEGVDDPKAIFGTTRGLQEKFGKSRVFDMPIAENGMTGVAVGAALAGYRPIMTHQRIDFLLYAMDQLVNQAAKRYYSSGGLQSIPLTVRAIVGQGWGQGSQHSQSLQALFAHIPGLKVVMPSSPRDAKGLLLASIMDNNPVIFVEHRMLYEVTEPIQNGTIEMNLGEARVVRTGSDVTVVATSTATVRSYELSTFRCCSLTRSRESSGCFYLGCFTSGC
jgi:pyruvate dehydrogenase E1 component beta subunit